LIFYPSFIFVYSKKYHERMILQSISQRRNRGSRWSELETKITPHARIMSRDKPWDRIMKNNRMETGLVFLGFL